MTRTRSTVLQAVRRSDDTTGIRTSRPAWLDERLYPFQRRYASVADCQVHYVDEGDGPVLLFVHGNAAVELADANLLLFDNGPYRVDQSRVSPAASSKGRLRATSCGSTRTRTLARTRRPTRYRATAFSRVPRHKR